MQSPDCSAVILSQPMFWCHNQSPYSDFIGLFISYNSQWCVGLCYWCLIILELYWLLAFMTVINMSWQICLPIVIGCSEIITVRYDKLHCNNGLALALSVGLSMNFQLKIWTLWRSLIIQQFGWHFYFPTSNDLQIFWRLSVASLLLYPSLNLMTILHWRLWSLETNGGSYKVMMWFSGRSLDIHF